MPQDIYLQPHAPDPVLSEETVLSIGRKYLPGVTSVTGVDESGGEARTYALEDDFILKVQRPHRLRPRTSLEKKCFSLMNWLKTPRAK